MMQLGYFPSFMYSDDPAVNPLLNAHVVYPPGIQQTTIQPIGPYYQSSRLTMMNGLGRKLSGLGTIASTVSGIGTFLVLALAGYGGYNVYKHWRK